jgi:drug/metabolite transporter (DMT)-like permease
MVLLSRAVPQGALEHPERTLAGIAMVLAAMFVFSGMDGLSKILARDYHPVEISCLRFFFTTLVLVPFIWRSSSPVWRTNMPLLQIGRGFCMVGSSILFIFGLARLPIADATAIGFVAPLLVTALSIPLLGETVGLRRWTAVVLGFGGVLIVVRPGTGAFDPAAIYPLLSAGSWALGLILTRKMRNADPVLTTLLYSTLVGFAAGAVVLPFVWRQPTALDWALIAVLGVLNAIGQSLMVVALNRAAASLIAPFSYSQMLWSALIGYFVFATIPDATMWVGAAIIMASGLYTLHRERVVAQQRRRFAATSA